LTQVLLLKQELVKFEKLLQLGRVVKVGWDRDVGHGHDRHQLWNGDLLLLLKRG
jgi:hypothetical protein